MKATGWWVFVIREKANQGSGQECCFFGSYEFSLNRRSGCPCATEISMIVSIFLSMSHCALGIFATRKHVNHRDEYGLEIPTNLQFLHFHGTGKDIKVAKKVK